MTKSILIFLIALTLTYVSSESEVISAPIPGQEYVYVHTADVGARPISRKEKSVDAADRPFETAHKLPIALTFRKEDSVAEEETKIKQKRDAPIPAPPGSIKIDVTKLIEKYKSELTASTTKAPATTKSPATTTRTPTRSPKSKRTRTKKEAPTTPNSILTTGAPSTPRTLNLHASHNKKVDDKLVASGSENKRSRIQIKKGPNGQEYEYEYVYYYYDDDDEEGAGKGKVTNSHDGPQRNSIPSRGKHSTTTVHPEPAANEVVPSTRGTRQRGRQLSHDAPEDKVAEERLPQNTRFPPRSRNLNTTPSTPEEDEPKSKTRQRGRPQATDNTADESQVSGRGRNRANVRRPSLELVDSASFNTHSSSDPGAEPYKEPKARGEQGKNGPSFPSELPEGPVRFLGATPNEKMDLQDLKSRLSDDEETSTNAAADSDSTVTTEEVGTTEMNAMDKVALDLYAILQGTQKLSGEDKEENSTDEGYSTTTEVDSTDETTTEILTTEELTTPTTTTTTTTTPTPTTTTAPEPVTGRGRFRGRPGAGGNRFKSSPSTTTSAPEPSTEKPKSKFSRPGPSFGGRQRPGARTTTEASAEPEVTKEDSKPVNSARPLSRNRFTGRRPPVPTTAAPEKSVDSTTAAASSRPGLPRRPSITSRRRTTTTKEPSEDESSPAEGSSDTPTTPKSIRGRVSGNTALRPLRPGPRINLAARGRPGAAASSTTAAPEGGAESELTSEEAPADGEEKSGETTPKPADDKNPINKLRNRPKINITPAQRPKTAASAPVQVRRTNPLLARRKPIGGAAAETSEAPTEAPQDAPATDAPSDEEEPSEAPSSTTEEPRGLNKLLAGRRRLVRPAPAH